MAKVFISFLGTGYYEPISYQFQDGEALEPTRFVQEAMIKKYCTDWTEEDKILIFLTEEALVNWDSPAQQSHFKDSYRGLKERIENLKAAPKLIPVDKVPSGVSTNDIWRLFMLVIEHLQDTDQVWFDVTHAYRSLPLMVTTILHYASVLKNIEIKSISYGAYDARKDEKAPVVELVALSVLQEWIIAANNYIKYGDAKYLKSLAGKETLKLIIAGGNDASDAKILSSMINGLNNYHEAITANRSIDIIKGFAFPDKESLPTSLIEPLSPLFGKAINIDQQIHKNSVRNTIVAARIAYKQNKLQQAVTMLQEGIVSLVAEEAKIPYMFKNGCKSESPNTIRENRQLVSSFIHYVGYQEMINSAPDSEQKSSWCSKLNSFKVNIAKELADWMKLSDISWVPAIAEKFIDLSLVRNDLNHAGYVDQLSVQKLNEKFENHLDFFENWIVDL